MQQRGQLTDRVKAKAKELLGYEINTIELRLMPYIQYTMINTQKLDPNHINQEEREILAKWEKAGYIEGVAGRMRITAEFWRFLSEILLLAYVDID